MSGTIEGGKRASLTNKQRYGADFYRVQGAKGGKNGRTGGFATKVTCTCALYPNEHYIQNCAGKKGGTVSRRPKAS